MNSIIGHIVAHLILGENAHDCYRWMQEQRADAIHPAANGLLLDPQELLDAPKVPVRIWGSAEPLYGQDKPLKMLDLERYRRLGVTDIFTNVPELYLV